MALTAGYTKSCTAKTSGVKFVHLVDEADVTTFGLVGEDYTSVTMDGGAVFKKYEFESGEAEYKETTNQVNGNGEVLHELQFFLGRMSGDSRTAVQEIIDSSNCGMIAIVTDNNGVQWAAGYSENFLKEEPLRLTSGEHTTGKAKTDISGRDVILTSSDNELARVFTNTIPV